MSRYIFDAESDGFLEECIPALERRGWHKAIHLVKGWVERTDYKGFHWEVADIDGYMIWVDATHWLPIQAPTDGDE